MHFFLQNIYIQVKWWSRVPRVSIRIFIKNDLVFIFSENALMLAVSVFQVPWKVQLFSMSRFSNALYEEKQHLNDQDFA